MEAWVPAIGVALFALVAIGEPLAEFFGFLADIREDLTSNRNDRRMYKKPSAKHVI